MSEYKTGTVVRLKSGGTLMTVAYIEIIAGVENAVCKWFEGKKQKGATIPTSMLEIVD